ncbi:MAG: hypothetical protein H6Q60_1056 [Oscillospiraceae bacterium]|nr:hypothetical protein [Oscillospiraceae bacterium]
MLFRRLSAAGQTPYRLVPAVIALLMTVSLTGCFQREETSGTSEETASSTASETETTSVSADIDLNDQIAALFAENIGNGDVVYLSLQLADSKGWKDKELSDESSAGQYYEQCLSGSYSWDELPEETVPETSDYIVTISNGIGSNYFQFFSEGNLVYYYQDGVERWFTATPQSGQSTVAELFRGWYDNLEYQAAVDGISISRETANASKVASAYGEALAAAYLTFAPGSSYAVTAAQLYSSEIYETSADANRFCFTLVLAVTPVDETSGAWRVGDGMELAESGTAQGMWLVTRQVELQKTVDGWKCVEIGTTGITLSDDSSD